MTHYRLEVSVFRCDECGDEEKEEMNVEYENPVEFESQFIDDLKERGWRYIEDENIHLCPECARAREATS